MGNILVRGRIADVLRGTRLLTTAGDMLRSALILMTDGVTESRCLDGGAAI